jgi:hypothetical protein
MRIVCSLCLLSLLWAAPASAQEDPGLPPRRVRGGLLLGAHVTSAWGRECTLTCDPIPGFDGTLEADLGASEGALAGGFVTLPLSQRLAVRIEALLAFKGPRATHLAPAVIFPEGQAPGQDVLIRYDLDHGLRYVQVPILAQWNIRYDGHFNPHALAGVGLGLLIGEDLDGDGQVLDLMGTPLGLLGA